MSITKLTKEFIAERMKEIGIRQANIVAITGNSKSTVSNWVNGISGPSGNEFPKLLKALKLSLINGEIIRDDYAGIEVPVVATSEIKTKGLSETSGTYTTKEKDIEFIISVNTHDFIFPFGTNLYIKKFKGVEDFKNNMFIIVEDEDNKLKIAKLTFFNENYYISQGSELKNIDLKSIKYKGFCRKYL